MFLFQLRNEFPSAQIELLTYPVIRARTRNTVPTNEFFMDINSLDRCPSIGPLSTFCWQLLCAWLKVRGGEQCGSGGFASNVASARRTTPIRYHYSLSYVQ